MATSRAPASATCGYSASAPTIASVFGVGFAVIAASRNPCDKRVLGVGPVRLHLEEAVVVELVVDGEAEEADEGHAVLHDDRHRRRLQIGAVAGDRPDRPCRRRAAWCRCRARWPGWSGRRSRRAAPGGPSSPPLAFTSSAQIWMAISAALPLPARPPVSAMPKPILIGSAAAVGHTLASSRIVAAAQPITVALILRNTGFSICSLPVAPAVPPGVLCRILERGKACLPCAPPVWRKRRALTSPCVRPTAVD